MFSYVIASIIPIAIIFILVTALVEKKDTLKLFSTGVVNGMKTTFKIFPYVFAITIASTLLRETGAMNIIITPISSILKSIAIPPDIVPLIILRPMSGSASTALVLDIIKNYGVNSLEARLATVIMGGTETTFYVVAILLGSIGIKNYRGTVVACIVSDITAILIAIILVKIGII